MPVTPELLKWLNEETIGLADWELFLVNQHVWERLQKEGRSEAEIAAILKILAPLDFLAHGQDRATWNSRFSPRQKADSDKGIEESPKLADIGVAEVDAWMELAQKLERPQLRARFGDAVWELGERIGGRKDPRLYVTARETAAAYFEIAKEERSREIYAAIQAAARSVELAAQIGAKQLVLEVFEFFMKMAAEASPESMGQWFAPFDRLLEQPCISRQQRDQIVTALEARFWQAVAGGDIHRQKFTGQALAKYNYDRQRYEKAREITLGYGEAIVGLCGKEKAGIAIHHLSGVADDYGRMGMRERADRVRVLIEQRGKEALGEMREHFVEIELDMSEVERQLIETVDHDSPYFALWRLAWRCTPAPADTAARRSANADGFTVHSIIPTSIMGEAGLPVASVGTEDRDGEGVLVLAYAREMQLSASLFTLGLEKWFARFGRDGFQDVPGFFECPLIPEDRREFFKQGFQAFADEDYLKAIHVLIPQVENSLRQLLAMLDQSVTKMDADGNFQQRNMNDALHDEVVKESLDDRLWMFLKVLYTDKRGMNLRNRVMHGIAELGDFSRHNAAMVLESVVLLTMLGERGVFTTSDAED